MYSVRTIDGAYVFGTAADEIIAAYLQDKTSLTIDGVEVEIRSVTTDGNGRKIIVVEVRR